MWVDFVQARSLTTRPISFRSHPPSTKRQSNILSSNFQSASWIWSEEAAPPVAPGEDRAFRRTYAPPSGKTSSFADIYITVDDRFTLFVDGKLVGASPSNNDQYGWRTSYAFHVPLGQGSSVFAVRGINLRDVDNGGDSPAGLLAAIQITHSDKSTSVFTSDASWRVSKVIPANFEQPSLDDSTWPTANIIFPYGDGPWGKEVVLPAAVVTVGSGTTTPSTPTSTSTSSTVPADATPSVTVISSTILSTFTPSPTNSNAAITKVTVTESGPQNTSSTGTSTISGAASGAQNTATPTKSNSIGPIAGGVIGGIAVLALLVLLFLCRKRFFGRKHYSDKELGAIAETVNPFRLTSPPGPPSNSEYSNNFLTAQRQPNQYEPVAPYQQPLGASASTYSVQDYNPQNPYNAPQSFHKPSLNQPVSTQGPVSGLSYYYQEQDNGSINGSSVAAPPSTLSRLQRLQELVAELSNEIAEHGEGGPYVSELRGRIAELTREDSQGGMVGTVSVPPAYESTREEKS